MYVLILSIIVYFSSSALSALPDNLRSLDSKLLYDTAYRAGTIFRWLRLLAVSTTLTASTQLPLAWQHLRASVSTVMRPNFFSIGSLLVRCVAVRASHEAWEGESTKERRVRTGTYGVYGPKNDVHVSRTRPPRFVHAYDPQPARPRDPRVKLEKTCMPIQTNVSNCPPRNCFRPLKQEKSLKEISVYRVLLLRVVCVIFFQRVEETCFYLLIGFTNFIISGLSYDIKCK